MLTSQSLIAATFSVLTVVSLFAAATVVCPVANANEFATKQEARAFNQAIKQDIKTIKVDRQPLVQQVKGLRSELNGLRQDFKAGDLNRSEFRTQRSSLQQSLKAARQQVQPLNVEIKTLRTQLVNLKTFVPTVATVPTINVAQTLPVIRSNAAAVVGQSAGQAAGQQVARTINALNPATLRQPTLARVSGATANNVRPNNTPIVLPKGQGTLLSLVADETMAEGVTVDVDNNLSVAFEATPQLLGAMQGLDDRSLKGDLYSRAVKLDMSRFANKVAFNADGSITFSRG